MESFRFAYWKTDRMPSWRSRITAQAFRMNTGHTSSKDSIESIRRARGRRAEQVWAFRLSNGQSPPIEEQLRWTASRALDRSSEYVFPRTLCRSRTHHATQSLNSAKEFESWSPTDATVHATGNG